VRVLSYNVDSSHGGAENVAAEVDRYAPDVVLMQEVGNADQLARAMSQRFPTVLVVGQFLAATRYPLLDETDPPKLSFEGRDRSPRFIELTLQTPLGQVAFYDVHPVSPRDEFLLLRARGLRHGIASGELFSEEVGRGVVANAALRELQVESIAEAASRQTLPTVIAGDTNLPGLSAAFARWLSQFQDGFTRAGWGLGYTFPTNHGHWPWMRIDRIMASDGLRFSWFRVGTSRASDHLCVVADLQLK
jgi:endonuclease/exonuclease/phosphatase family metal-dependent hydrolase